MTTIKSAANLEAIIAIGKIKKRKQKKFSRRISVAEYWFLLFLTTKILVINDFCITLL